jgi:hypothetical protein
MPDVQLDLFGGGVPIGELPASGSFVPVDEGVWEELDEQGKHVQLHASSRAGQKKIAENLEPGTYDPATVEIPY